jgi:predicted enzyme related to lactoylglutathione lyase
MQLGYVNVSVTDFDRALTFYGQTLGLPLRHADRDFGYAAFATGPASLAVVRDDDPTRVGRHTGIGLTVADLDAEYERLRGAGVTFSMVPAKQPWGGYMALFEDPDGNVFYLDQVQAR